MHFARVSSRSVTLAFGPLFWKSWCLAKKALLSKFWIVKRLVKTAVVTSSETISGTMFPYSLPWNILLKIIWYFGRKLSGMRTFFLRWELEIKLIEETLWPQLSDLFQSSVRIRYLNVMFLLSLWSLIGF